MPAFTMRPVAGLAIAFVVSVLLLGCGGASKNESGSSTTTPTPVASAPIPHPCSYLSDQDLDAIFGGHFTAVPAKRPWMPASAVAAYRLTDPLHQLDHAYVELGLASCAWTGKTPASTQPAGVSYTLQVYGLPIKRAQWTKIPSQIGSHTVSVNLGTSAAFSYHEGIAILQAVVGRVVLTVVTKTGSGAQQRECTQLAKLVASHLS